MAVNLKYDKVTRVEIGYAGGALECVNITNVVSFADRVVSPDGDMLDPMSVINTWRPTGVHHNHKYWEMEMVLDTNWLHNSGVPTAYWEYTQAVDGLAGNPAINDVGANPNIEWFRVIVRESDGTVTTLTYVEEHENVVWCVGKTTNISNEKGTRHQTTTFRFICLGERLRT